MPEKIGIRMNQDVYRKAKAQAALDGKPVGQWITEAIEAQLKKQAQK